MTMIMMMMTMMMMMMMTTTTTTTTTTMMMMMMMMVVGFFPSWRMQQISGISESWDGSKHWFNSSIMTLRGSSFYCGSLGQLSSGDQCSANSGFKEARQFSIFMGTFTKIPTVQNVSLSTRPKGSPFFSLSTWLVPNLRPKLIGYGVTAARSLRDIGPFFGLEQTEISAVELGFKWLIFQNAKDWNSVITTWPNCRVPQKSLPFSLQIPQVNLWSLKTIEDDRYFFGPMSFVDWMIWFKSSVIILNFLYDFIPLMHIGIWLNLPFL